MGRTITQYSRSTQKKLNLIESYKIARPFLELGSTLSKLHNDIDSSSFEVDFSEANGYLRGRFKYRSHRQGLFDRNSIIEHYKINIFPNGRFVICSYQEHKTGFDPRWPLQHSRNVNDTGKAYYDFLSWLNRIDKNLDQKIKQTISQIKKSQRRISILIPKSHRHSNEPIHSLIKEFHLAGKITDLNQPESGAQYTSISGKISNLNELSDKDIRRFTNLGALVIRDCKP
jgi:hypothetical protein